MRGQFCRLQFLLALASTVILAFKSRGPHDHVLLSLIRDSLNLEGQVPVIYVPQKQGCLVMPPGTGFPLKSALKAPRSVRQ
jgi:hypothetical protein